MKLTHRDNIDFINAAAQYLSRHPGETKFSYALGRVLKRAQKLHLKFQEKREDLQIDNCLADDKGKILRNAQNEYDFTKDGLKKLNEECRAALDSEIDIEPYIATELPEGDVNCPHCKQLIEHRGLTQLEKDAFTGFVIGGDREE